jgi:hypothetical protein
MRRTISPVRHGTFMVSTAGAIFTDFNFQDLLGYRLGSPVATRSYTSKHAPSHDSHRRNVRRFTLHSHTAISFYRLA